MKRFGRTAILLLTLSLCLFPVLAGAGSVSRLWESWNAEGGVAFTADIGITFNTHMPFDESRRGMLNALLSHVTLRVSEKKDARSVGILIDGESALSFTQTGTGAETRTRYSFLPDTEIVGDFSAVSGTEGDLIGLPKEAGLLTGSGKELLDGAFALFGRLPEMYPEQSKLLKEKQALKGVGTSTYKVVVTFTKAQVAEGKLSSLPDACPDGGVKEWLKKAEFTGRQQVKLFYNENDELIRVEYSGTVGEKDGTARKVSVSWSRRFTETEGYERLILKTPTLQGSDHDNMEWTFTEKDMDGTGVVSAELSLDRSLNKVKRTFSCKADLTLTEEKLSGKVTLTGKAGDSDKLTWVLAPELTATEPGAVEGTLGYQLKNGKNVLEDALVSLKPVPGCEGEERTAAATVIRTDALSGQEQETLREQLLYGAARALVRPLLALPREDLDYLLYEMDDMSLDRIFGQPDDNSSERSAS